MSYDALSLTAIFLVSVLTLYIIYLRAQWKQAIVERDELEESYNQIKHGDEIERLAEAYGLETYRNRKRVSQRELDEYAGPDETIIQETLHQMKEELIQRLIRDGAIQVVQKNMPAKPFVELELFVRACKNDQSRLGEPYQEFMDRTKRPLGTR